MIRVFLAVLMGAPALAAAQQPVARTFAVAGDVSMRIWVPGGTVRVDTWDRDSVRVTGTVGRGTHFFGGGQGHGAKVGVELDDLKDTAIPKGDLVVTVPRKAHVWVKMTDGVVTAVNTSGEFEAITVTGSITVQDAQGVVSVETIDAAVTIAGVTGEVRARSGGGHVALRQIHGTLTTATISGAVEIAGMEMQDARIETIGGGITVRGTLAPKAVLDLETHSGAITLFLSQGTPPGVALTTRAGTVRNPLAGAKPGNGQIVAHSFKGDINVVPVTGIEAKKGNSPL